MKDNVFKHIKDIGLREFKICIIFQINKFELILFQPSNAWRAEVSQDELSVLASQLKMDPDEYYSRIKQYLSDTPENMTFKVTDKEFIMHHTLENNIKMKLFFCSLEKVNYCHYVEKLLDQYHEEKNEYKEKYDLAIRSQDELEQSKEELQKKLQEFVKRKKDDDEVLYNNFVLVLNEKKRQIQHLTQTLEAFKRGRPTHNPPVKVKKEKRGTEVNVKKEMSIEKKEVSDSNTDEEPPNYNTDEDDDYDYKSNVRQNHEIDNLPSTSKQDFSLFLDDSPPHHILPKRQKTAQTMEISIKASQVSKENSFEEKQVTDGAKEESKVDNEFNTQDLLDLL
ncbi:unnamed protein product [Phaedon cochleariae]|uniref:Uncharacterized protein n=1 Tax=Phaedon cochleariae TaxID=80249 RepID=A0A9N9X025_PHACE|nr:unnamed protein product [Phaedon cochleariae]